MYQHQIAIETDDTNIKELVVSLDKFLDNKQLQMVRRQPNWTERLGRRIFPFFSKALTQQNARLARPVHIAGL